MSLLKNTDVNLDDHGKKRILQGAKNVRCVVGECRSLPGIPQTNDSGDRWTQEVDVVPLRIDVAGLKDLEGKEVPVGFVIEDWIRDNIASNGELPQKAIDQNNREQDRTAQLVRAAHKLPNEAKDIMKTYHERGGMGALKDAVVYVEITASKPTNDGTIYQNIRSYRSEPSAVKG